MKYHHFDRIGYETMTESLDWRCPLFNMNDPVMPEPRRSSARKMTNSPVVSCKLKPRGLRDIDNSVHLYRFVIRRSVSTNASIDCILGSAPTPFLSQCLVLPSRNSRSYSDDYHIGITIDSAADKPAIAGHSRQQPSRHR